MTMSGLGRRFLWLFFAVSVFATTAVLLAVRAAAHGSVALGGLAALVGRIALLGIVMLARIVVLSERQRWRA